MILNRGRTAICRCPRGHTGDPYSRCSPDPCSSNPCGKKLFKLFVSNHSNGISREAVIWHIWLQRIKSKVILDSTFAQIRKHFVQVSERLAKTMEMSLFANVHQDLRETRMCPAGLFSVMFCWCLLSLRYFSLSS